MASPEQQEIYCHNCNKHVQFVIDMEISGKHVLNCPNCGHKHCRYVDKGKITDERWASRNPQMAVTYVTGATCTAASVTVNAFSISGSISITNSWACSSSVTGGYYL